MLHTSTGALQVLTYTRAGRQSSSQAKHFWWSQTQCNNGALRGPATSQQRMFPVSVVQYSAELGLQDEPSALSLAHASNDEPATHDPTLLPANAVPSTSKGSSVLASSV